MEELLTTQEVAKFLRLDITTIQRWSRLGIFPAVKLGRRFLFEEDDVKNWIRQHKVAQTPKEQLINMTKAGESYFKKWCKARGIDIKRLTEERVMDLINKVISKHRKSSQHA